MDPALTKAVVGAVRAGALIGVKALRSEWLRRRGDAALGLELSAIDDVLDEALAILANDPTNLVEAVSSRVKTWVAQPALFKEGAPRAWIRTERAQRSLKSAFLAAIRGEDETGFTAEALALYDLFTADFDPAAAPDASLVYDEAIDFLTRSVRRHLTLDTRIVLGAIQGVHDKIDRLSSPDATALVDRDVRERVEAIRQSRFFRSAKTDEAVTRLADALVSGTSRGASAATRAWALAWCARLTAFDPTSRAAAYLADAEALALDENDDVLVVARALIAARDDAEAGLRLLNPDASALQATAMLQILRRAIGTEASLERAERAGIDIDVLDSDGRFVLINCLVELHRWEAATEAVKALGESDFDATPALLWSAGALLVASRIPQDLRTWVIQTVPTNPAGFPLGDDPTSLEARRLARTLIAQAAERCDTLGLAREADAARRYVLWLALRDSETKSGALAQLRERMREADGGFAYLPLALGFELDVDRAAAERLIGKQLARSPAASQEIVDALIALLIDHAMRDPQEAYAYLTRHRSVLENWLDPTSLIPMEVQILTDAGRAAEAEAVLAGPAAAELPVHLREVLRSAAASTDAEASIDALEAAYAANEQTPTLLNLLQRHAAAGASPRYVELARILFSQVTNTDLAKRVIAHLCDHGREAEAADLLELLGDAVGRSDGLLSIAAQLYYRRGRFSEAEHALAQLEARRDTSDYRELRLQLLVATGKWEALDAFIETQWQARSSRSALELAKFGGLAAQVGAKRAADFALAAVEADSNSPDVLVTAYSAVTAAGLEDSLPQAGAWIMQAAELSGEDGPVWQASLQELMDGAPDWDARVEEAMRALAAGSLPIGVIAAMLRRTWLELQLVPLLGNPTQVDGRARSLVALFSGRRQHDGPENFAAQSLALDTNALVTLAALGLLDTVFGAFAQVIVRHDCLAKLFEQRLRLAFHQPSRIAFAHRVVELIAAAKVLPFQSVQVPDLALVAAIGSARAEMIVTAAAQPSGQHVVIHPFPITRVGSLLTEPMALDEFAPHLASCSAVVDLLRRVGRLTKIEAASAMGYLGKQEERWPAEPRIEPGATLYLTDLAVSYLRYTGLLDRIVEAGLKPIISPTEVTDARALLDLETIAERVDTVLTQVRTVVAEHSARGRVEFQPAPIGDEDDFEVRSLTALAVAGDVLVCDDRFVNRYANFAHGEGESRIVSSVELIAQLAAGGVVGPEELDAARTLLRRGGAAFVPVSAEELLHLVGDTELADPVSHDAEPTITETGELRALRENIRLAQARGWLDPAADMPWLMGLHQAVGSALAAQWQPDIPDELAGARSTWLARLLDLRAWADTLARREENGLALRGSVLDVSRLASLGQQVASERREVYEAWLEREIIDPLFTREPEQADLVYHNQRSLVCGLADDMARQEPQLDQTRITQWIFDSTPACLQLGMLQDAEFQARVGYGLGGTMTIGKAEFNRDDVLAAAAALYAAPTKRRAILDVAGDSWQVKTGKRDWSLQFRRGETGYRVRGLLGLHPTPDARTAMFDAILAKEGLSPDVLPEWRALLAHGVLDGTAIAALDAALQALPPMAVQAIIDSLDIGKIAPEGLVPRDANYFEQLVGPSGAADLTALLADPQRAAIDWAATDAVTRASWLLLRAAHPGVLSPSLLATMTPAERERLAVWVVDQDPMAQAAFVELALPLTRADPELERHVLEIVPRLAGLNPDDPAGPLHLWSCVTIFVDGELSLHGTLKNWPVFRRRQAAMAQAALITRTVFGQINTERFAQFCLAERGWRYAAQGLVDLRREPRWRPDLIAPDQLYQEVLGRMVNAAGALAEDARTPAIAACFFDPDHGLAAKLELPMAYWPGPLEGAINLELRPPPAELLAAIEAGLESDPLDHEAVNRLVNAEAMFRLPDDLIERGTARIKAAGPALLMPLAADQIAAYLRVLAHFAASRRLGDFADTVRLLARHHRAQAGICVPEEMQLGLYCAATSEDLPAWRDTIGNWALELANRIDDVAEAEVLLGWIDTIGAIDPASRARTGRARGQLNLFLGR